MYVNRNNTNESSVYRMNGLITSTLKQQRNAVERRVGTREIETELLRKSIHLLIAAVPLLAAIDVSAALTLLGTGAIIYTYSEMSRRAGYSIRFISSITFAAARDRDAGRFVLGPVTLALGAMVALLLYPLPAASIAIYALAFGDGLSSLIGKLFGRIHLPFTGGKTVAGSLACFAAVFVIAFRSSGRIVPSLLVAAGATALEALPTKDLDNIILPVGTGFLAAELLL